MTPKTARLVCPLCTGDFPVVEFLDAGRARHRCVDCGYTAVLKNHPEDPYTDGEPGVLGDLGLLDDLPACLHQGEPWVEYGIVEYRYRLQAPGRFADLVARNGHTAFGPRRNTASNMIGMALGHLQDAGVLVSRSFGKGTGYWNYNPTITSWALPPGPEDPWHVTWEEFVAGAPDGLPLDEDWVMSPEAVSGGLVAHPRRAPAAEQPSRAPDGRQG